MIMKKISCLLISILMVCSVGFCNITQANALDNKNEYITYEKLTIDEELRLLEDYDSVTVYRSGTHSTSTILSDKTTAYGFIGYHPDTSIWDTATGYSVSTSKTVKFEISLNYKVTNDTTIKIGAASSNTSTFSRVYTLTDDEIKSVRYDGNRTKLGVYAKVRKKVVNYKIYDNTTGLLLQNFNYAYITTWDGDGVQNKVDYRVELKNPV